MVKRLTRILLQEKFRAALPRVETCVWYARSRLAQYQALPRDHEDRGCHDLYVPCCVSVAPHCALNAYPAVAERLKREGRHEIFEQETMEELEDEEGNVYSRKTYDDLKKQGLI